MALTKLNNASLSAVTSAGLPTGTVLQTVSYSHSTMVDNLTTTFQDTNAVNLAITPISTSSRIYIMINQTLQIWNQSAFSTGRWRVQRSIGGGSYSSIQEDTSSTNGNLFAYDYGGSGLNIIWPTQFIFLDTPNTVSQVTYKTQIAKGSNGANRISSDVSNTGHTILMEIAG
jgi:hypothetical protein